MLPSKNTNAASRYCTYTSMGTIDAAAHSMPLLPVVVSWTCSLHHAFKYCMSPYARTQLQKMFQYFTRYWFLGGFWCVQFRIYHILTWQIWQQNVNLLSIFGTVFMFNLLESVLACAYNACSSTLPDIDVSFWCVQFRKYHMPKWSIRQQIFNVLSTNCLVLSCLNF